MRSAAGCALLGVVLLLVAGTFDAEPLYVTGIALALLGAGAAAWIGLGARGASLHREVGARSVLEDEPLTVRLEARAGALPLPPGWIDEPLLPEPVRFRAGRSRARVRAEISFGRRGRRALAPPALVLRDPFGLAERVVPGGEAGEVLVLPRTFRVRAMAGGAQSSAGRAGSMLTAAAETEMDGLRPHVEGAPASRIHWPTVARGVGIMERRLIAEADSRPIVVLDPRGASGEDTLDAAVRATGSLVLHFAAQRGCALLLPGDRRPHLIETDRLAWPAAHARLAVVDGSAGPALNSAQNRRGLIVYVAARTVDRVPAALGRTPGGSLLVVPGTLPNRRAVFEVAGCHGYVGARAGGAAAVAAVGATA